MMPPKSIMLLAASSLLLAACFGNKAKVPADLLTLSSTAPESGIVTSRTAVSANAITIEVPVIPKELASVRVPVQSGPTAIAYVKDLQWVETPDRLMQDLLSETLIRRSGRVVLDPKQTALDPGLRVSGILSRMGYDANEGVVIVRYDAALSRDSLSVESRRFEAKIPADGRPRTVAPALQAAANQVAEEVAIWLKDQ